MNVVSLFFIIIGINGKDIELNRDLSLRETLPIRSGIFPN